MQVMNDASLPNDPAALREMIRSLHEQLEERDSQLAERDTQLAERDTQLADANQVVDELTEKVRLYEAIIHAKRSEQQAKPGKDEEQYSLFDEAEVVAQEPPSEPEPETVRVPEHSRSKRGRKPISESIPRRDVVHDIPEEEKVCGCGCELTRIGEVVSEKLHFVPATVEVERHIRPKYACRQCEGTEDDGPTLKVAPMPPQLIKQGIATSGLLAYILVNKFCDGLPFYRQSRMFDRLGVDISRSTMSSWALQAAGKCEPLIDLLFEKLREGDIINLDETPVQILGEVGRKNTTTSYMWVARGGEDGKPVVLFRYAPSRSGKVARQLVGNFQGYLQTDGYAGYDALGEAEGIVHVGCLVHVRRKFMEALKAGSKKKKGTASTVVDLIGKLYHLESQARKEELSLDGIAAMRREKVQPILKKIKEQMQGAIESVPPKSLLGQALSYGLGQWPRIEAYLLDPRLTPDNNPAENAIRPFAVGRKNWLFSGSPRGAFASAALYSLVESAKANGLNPLEYLAFLFDRIPQAESREDLEALLPWAMSKTPSAE